MEENKLKILVENELYSLVLANSDDELAKINYNTIGISINQFVEKYKEELTNENIEFITNYIWTIINKKQNSLNKGIEK